MIYGSHNSCTYGSLQGCCKCIFLPWTKNQSLTIIEQLEKGVRYFDFRISYCNTDEQLYLSHSFLTEHAATSIFNQLFNFLSQLSEQPFFIVHLRVDYNDRSNQKIIAPILSNLLNFYSNSIMTRSDLYYNEQQIAFNDLTIKNKVLIYCEDGTIQHPLVFSSDLMPTVSFWNAGTVEECERRIQKLEDEFAKQSNGPFLFLNERMIMFDFSNNYPLWFTDYQQFRLMNQYKDVIISSKPTILAGNCVEKIIEVFTF